MSSLNSEASILPLGETLAQPEALLDQFVDTGPEPGRRAEYRADASRAEAILAESEGSLSLSIAPSLEAIEAEWRALEARACISPYQLFDLAAAWLRHAAAGEGVAARIGVVRDAADRVVVILPFGVTRQYGTRIAVYLGGAHFNINMPLVDPSLLLGPRTASRLLDAYADAAEVDLLKLCNQPETWKGTPHPFLCLPHYAAADDTRLIVIDGDFDAYLLGQLSRKMRSQLRRKSMKFKDAGVGGAMRASTPEEVERYLGAMIEQKSRRLAAQGLDDPFVLPGVKDFLREAALRGLGGNGGLELRAVGRDGQLLSVRAGVRHGDHHSLMLQSYDTEHPMAKHTPGEYLLSEVLLTGRMQGVTNFDFGIGDGRFKQVWSNDVLPMFNIARGVTKTGRMLAGLVQSRDAAKRYIKRHPRLFSAVQDARVLGAKLKNVAGLLVMAQ